MSKIEVLDKNIDLWLTQSWSTNNHGICGHTFEIIEYFYILNQHFKVGVLLAEDIDWDILERAIKHKYKFDDIEISNFKKAIRFSDRPKIVSGTNILFVDGGVINTSNVTLLFDNILYFACGNKEIKNNIKENVYVLQDDRVYSPVKVNGINYKKKILFDKLIPVENTSRDVLVYATKNCRRFDDYNNILKYGNNVIVITNRENKPTEKIDGITFMVPPVDNLFERFGTYVYTPVPRHWDCSPRFIAECKHYGKEVIYHNIDYWEEDWGLYWRKWDVENDFDSIRLTPDDGLVDILNDIIE